MHLLVMGDLEFLGHHAAAAALGQGHRVTVLADAEGHGSTLEGALVVDSVTDGSWDAVLVAGGRTPGRLPEVPVVGWFGDAAATPPPEATVSVRVADPVGPRDPSDRFTYWPLRLARAVAGTREGPVLVPGDPDHEVRLSDARDVADWVVRLLDEGVRGEFDVAGPGSPTTLREVLTACLAASDGDPDAVELVWVDQDFLAGELPPQERPLWFDEGWGGTSVPAGLEFRPVEQTARDTMVWAWDHAIADGLDQGVPADREQELITAWRAR